MNFIVDLVVTRHLTTFTHSVMVSYLAEAIGKHILAARPELLRIPSSYLEGNVYASPAEVLDYIVPAALFHDIGKNGMIPIINTQHRKLNDYEFNIIQTHPQKGSDYLSSDPDFLSYQPVALGHHRSYDGTRGYPLSFDNTASPYRDAIDLIHICDCLDAATDYLRAILITKSGISNHAASDIPDHLCFSKFGTFHVVCPQTADNLRTFCVCPLLAPLSKT